MNKGTLQKGISIALLGILSIYITHLLSFTGVSVWILFPIALLISFLYLIPALIAKSRRHRNMVYITVANVLVGWTIFGWIGSFAWAFTDRNAVEPQS